MAFPGIDSSGGGGTHISDASPTSSGARVDSQVQSYIGGNSGISFGRDRTTTLVYGGLALAFGIGVAMYLGSKKKHRKGR